MAKSVEDRIARLEALMDQVVQSPRVRPYVLGQVEQSWDPAAFVEPTNELKAKFPPTKEEVAAEAEVERCRVAMEAVKTAQAEAQMLKPGTYLTTYADGSQVRQEFRAGEVGEGIAMEMTPELKDSEFQLIKAKTRLFKLQRERDAKARAWSAEQSGMKRAPAEKQLTRRFLG